MTPNEEILFIGPRARGGMDEVLKAYASSIPGAAFVTSYRGGSAPRKIADFIGGYARAAWLLLTRPGIKIVHIHSASNASFRRKMYFARLARRLGRKVVIHVHGGGFRDFMATDPDGIRAALNSCDEVICLTEQWRDFFTSQGVDGVHVLPNPVDYPAEVGREEDSSKIHFLFMGTLDRAKGVHDIVGAVASLPADIRSRMVMHIGGAGQEELPLRESIAGHGLEENIVLEGWVTGADKQRLLRQCQCYVLPSYFEGQPVSILEAMAWQMPVIATRVGGIPSVVHDGVNGILITPGDTAALADAITAVVNRPDMRRDMGVRSREMAAAYSTQEVVKSLSKIYSRYGVDI
ncbi:MAG: glycosyltransferase family 4 protein [Duncaniella sp.]|nr:glycosyltransferase family 4 protein [Duncaniella sp.]